MLEEEALNIGRHDFCNKYGWDKELFYDKVHGKLIQQILKESLKSIEKDSKKEIKMSKVKDMLLGMQEEAPYFTKEAFISKYGWTNEHVWDGAHEETSNQLTLEIDDD